MKCPKCRQVKWVYEARDAALILIRGKLRPIPGYYCEMCSHTWSTSKTAQEAVACQTKK